MLLFMSILCLGSFAQKKEVIVKAGTLIPLHATNSVCAADVKVGDKVNFKVSRDVSIDGVTAIPYGTMASGKVTEAKKSSWWGTKGRLKINITDIIMPNGTAIPVENGNVQINGTNRTPIAVIAFLFVWPGCFICGSKAEMQSGYEIQTTVAANTTLTVE